MHGTPATAPPQAPSARDRPPPTRGVQRGAVPGRGPASHGSRLRGRWRWLPWGLAALIVVAAPLPFTAPGPAERHLRIEASSFAFSPAVISVNPGDKVTLELVASDVVHGLYLDGYDLSVTADPGQTASLTFVADRAGTFRFRCSVTCGALHPFMVGKLRVGANGLFWRAAVLSVLAVIAGIWSVRR